MLIYLFSEGTTDAKLAQVLCVQDVLAHFLCSKLLYKMGQYFLDIE